MPERHLLPFALPHGRTGTTGKLTVYFSPRLKARGRLSDYPEWLDWPATMRGAGPRPPLAVAVRVNGAAVPSVVTSVAPSSPMWTAVFAATAPVAAHRFVDYSATPLLPAAFSDFSEAVLDLYLKVASAYPAGPPDGPGLLALAEAAILATADADPATPGTIAETKRYRTQMPHAVEHDAGPSFDFHQAVSLLGHHPELLRWLGLAVDLDVDLAGVGGAITDVRVRTNYAAIVGPQAREGQLVTSTSSAFFALPNPDPAFTEQDQGFLRLTTQKAYLSIVDPHVAASRLTATGDRAGNNDDGTLPALSTRALTLVRPDLVTAFANRTLRQAELEADLQANLAGGPPVRLFAEDVTVGQRIDVADQGTWRSLFARESEAGYSFPRNTGLAVVPAPDEGWNMTLLATEQDDTRPEPLPDTDIPIAPTAMFRLDDALYRWDGWSGAAPPPGGAVDAMAGTRAADDPNAPTADQAVQVAVDYHVSPDTLPRLRFGRRYRMRARCVDLSGVSRDLSAVAPPTAIAPPETFGRLEPVAAPTVLRRGRRPDPGVGDTPHTIVLLSDWDTPDTDVVPADRLVFSGRVPQDLCELHGLPSGGVDPGSYRLLAARDAKSLDDQTVADPTTGERVAGSIDANGAIVTGPRRQAIGYLSDPAADSIHVGLGSFAPALQLPFAGTWPQRDAVRIEVAAGTGAPVRRPDATTDLRVFLPKAEIVPVDVSCGLGAGFLDHFGLWQRLSPPDQQRLRRAVASGTHWMFTPSQHLQLVHAVRRPLTAPLVGRLSGSRGAGATAVTLDGRLDQVDHKSTDSVVLRGSWTDTVDDLAQASPLPRGTTVELGRLTVGRSDATDLAVTALRAELHDTKRHLVAVELDAISSFAAYFTERTELTMTDPTVTIDGQGIVTGRTRVEHLGTGRGLQAGVDYRLDGAAGTITRVDGGAIAAGDRVSVTFIARPINRSSDEHGPRFEILVPSTVAPPPPVVHSAIPAFAYVKSSGGSSSETELEGGLVRVYLERPWLVTGDGESLGVVLDPVGAPLPGLTALGRDPLVPGPGPTMQLTVADFPRATTTVSAFDGVHDLAVHPVAFDADSGRWYSDVQVATGDQYRPFLTLTLARYQPDSLGGLSTSSFVTLDPVRLGVTRNVAVVEAAGTVEVTVTGVQHGGIPDRSAAGGADVSNTMRITLQEADPNVVDPDLRWCSVGTNFGGSQVVTTGGATTWSTTVVLPSAAATRRLLVEELEPVARTVDGVVTMDANVVFVDTIELTA